MEKQTGSPSITFAALGTIVVLAVVALAILAFFVLDSGPNVF